MSPSLNPERLRLAESAMAGNDLPQAAALCQIALAMDPNDARALNLMGMIGARAGVTAQAAHYFRRAEAGGDASAADNLRALSQGTEPSRGLQAGLRYLLIKSWGMGFWSDVCHVLGGLLLAEITGRCPVVHWGSNCLFGDGSPRDHFTAYFASVGEETVADLADLGDADVFPAKWRGRPLTEEDNNKWAGADSGLGALPFLGRRERIAVADYFLSVTALAPWIPEGHPLAGASPEALYRDLIARYLRPTAAMHAHADAFFRGHLAGAPYVAVHLRGFEKMTETPNLLEENNRVIAQVGTLPQALPIFMLSDDERYVALMRDVFGSRIIATDAERIAADGEVRGVHHGGGDRVQRGRDMLRDTLLALRADHFVGNGNSNVAGMIAMLRKWPAYRCTLVCPPLFLQPRAGARLPARIAGNLCVPGYDEAAKLWRPAG